MQTHELIKNMELLFYTFGGIFVAYLTMGAVAALIALIFRPTTPADETDESDKTDETPDLVPQMPVYRTPSGYCSGGEPVYPPHDALIPAPKFPRRMDS